MFQEYPLQIKQKRKTISWNYAKIYHSRKGEGRQAVVVAIRSESPALGEVDAREAMLPKVHVRVSSENGSGVKGMPWGSLPAPVLLSGAPLSLSVSRVDQSGVQLQEGQSFHLGRI